jgi:hypothetical protein
MHPKEGERSRQCVEDTEWCRESYMVFPMDTFFVSGNFPGLEEGRSSRTCGSLQLTCTSLPGKAGFLKVGTVWIG